MAVEPKEPLEGSQRAPPEPKPGKSVAEMISEALREAAILIAVFGALDRAMKSEPFWQGAWPWVVIVVATLLFLAGVAIERIRSNG